MSQRLFVIDYSAQREPAQYGVEIHTEKNVWLILGLVLYFGVKTPHKLHRFYQIVDREILTQSHPEPLMVLFCCVLALLVLASLLFSLIWPLWSFWGREVIEIRQDQLQVQWRLFGVGPHKNYWLNQISNVRASVLKNPIESIFKGGNIAFDYNGKGKRIAWTLNEQDAFEVAHAIRAHVPESTLSLIR